MQSRRKTIFMFAVLMIISLLIACGGSSGGGSGDVAPPNYTPALNAPSNLTATGAGEAQIDLSWTDNSSDENGFKIERKTSGGEYSEIATVCANVTNFSDTGIASNSTYFYRVRAYNDNGNSAYSNEASAAASTTHPAAPTGLNAEAVSSSQINLSWTDASNNEAGFRIERSLDGNNWSQIAEVAADTVSYVDTGLDGNTTYYYRVRAYNTVGNSDYSNTASTKTNDNIPDAPTGLDAVTYSSSQIDLSWTDNSDNETGFTIERSPNGTSSWEGIATVGANVTTYSDTGLQYATTYYYRVRAYNAQGNSAW
jgi:fibronectin type 3 domain-containing protein